MKRGWRCVQIGLCLSAVMFGGCVNRTVELSINELPDLGRQTRSRSTVWPELTLQGGQRQMAEGPIEELWIEQAGRFTAIEPRFDARIVGETLEIMDEDGPRTFRVSEISSVVVDIRNVKERRTIAGGGLVAGGGALFVGGTTLLALGIPAVTGSKDNSDGLGTAAVYLGAIAIAGGFGMGIPGLRLLLTEPDTPEEYHPIVKPTLSILPGGASVSMAF